MPADSATRFHDCCQACGNQLTPGGAALACGADGKAVRIPLPAHCADPECRRERDERAIREAIARGVINP